MSRKAAKFAKTKYDELVKSRNSIEFVIPAKAGIQLFQDVLDPGFRRGDAPRDFLRDHQISSKDIFEWRYVFSTQIYLCVLYERRVSRQGAKAAKEKNERKVEDLMRIRKNKVVMVFMPRLIFASFATLREPYVTPRR